MTNLHDKVAVITGGTTGIGLATAQRFVEDGAYVFITGRRQAELDAAVAAIGHDVEGVRADVSKPEDLAKLYEVVAHRKGRIDVLFANAGGGRFAALGEIREDDFDATFGINVKGTLFTVQGALPLLSNGASIILAGSTTTITGTPAFSVYSATKAAIRSFARNWALDLKDRQIRVNTISPGPTDTPGWDDLFPKEQLGAIKAGVAAQIPLGRMGQPREIAAAVAFLASDDASFVNGAELFVDGGAAQI